jgi:thiosulfate reductase/polysulfide reductase chain A
VDGPPAFVDDGMALVFDTPSTKVELSSSILEQAGIDPVPTYTAHEQPPAGMLRMLYGRVPMHTFGRTTNAPILGEIMDENMLWVHTAVAKRLGLERGQKVMLVNQDGKRSGPIKLRPTEGIRHDCCYLPHGFGHSDPRLTRAFGKGASDAALVTRFEVDPLMGGTGMNVNFVSIEPAEV